VEQFGAQRKPWEAFVRSPDAHERLQVLAAEAARRELAEAGLRLSELAEAGLRLSALAADLANVRAELEAHRATVSWRVTAPLRAFRRLTRRGGR